VISHVFLARNTEHLATPRAALATIFAMRWWFVALALAVVPRSLGAQPLAEPPGGTPRIAVVPTIVVRLDVARVDALAQELAAALHDELEVEAIGGVEVRRRLPGYGSLPDCVATPACITDAARRLDAQQLLFLVVIGTASGAIQIDATWIDPVTHQSASRPAINLATLADAPNQFASAAHQLLPALCNALGEWTAAEELDLPLQSPTTDTTALFSWMGGLSRLWRRSTAQPQPAKHCA